MLFIILAYCEDLTKNENADNVNSNVIVPIP